MSTPEQRSLLMLLVCQEFECTVEDMQSPSSLHRLANARKVYIHLVRKHLQDTMHRIANDLKRDHSTIVKALQVMEELFCHNKKELIVERHNRIEKEFLNLKHPEL